VSGRLPVWERLRAPDHRRLEIGPVRRVEVDEALVRDGNLPDLDGATVFDAWTRDDGYVLRAARMDDVTVHPYHVHAERLRIEESDGRLEALLAGAGPVAAAGELERMACACRGVSVDAVYRAIGGGWSTVDAVKRVTRLAFGPCQGRRCVPWLAARLELEADDPRAQITPRPPLVPVPVSLLAAYAAEQV
jgi:hypothetical protein